MSFLETDDRLISPTAPAGKREEAIDRAIRPTSMADYIGQPQVRANRWKFSSMRPASATKPSITH
jgi:Holliday junction resolvasome RuvABC ATP-dependent DNA helicase subunit